MMSSDTASPLARTGRRVFVGILFAVPICIPTWMRIADSQREITELESHTTFTSSTLTSASQLQKRLGEAKAELRKARLQTIADEELPDLESQLVDLVREVGCQIRQINSGQTTRRMWFVNDDPIRPHEADEGDPTPFELHTTPISIHAVGDMQAVLACIDRLRKQQILCSLQQVDLSPDKATQGMISLHIDILVFDFTQVAAETLDNGLY